MHHEACHALLCVLRVPVSAIRGHRRRRWCRAHHRKVDLWRTTLITLAPYVISLLLMPLLLLLPWLSPGWLRLLVDGSAGLALIQHVRSLVPQLMNNWRSKESDCYRAGWLLSLAVIGAAQIALLGLVVAGSRTGGGKACCIWLGSLCRIALEWA